MMNRTVTRVIGVLAASVLAIGGLAACGSSSGSNGKGKVYYLNFKPEAADQWKKIAETYTKETGVKVNIRTAASGTYEQTLKSEMAKSNAPTLFQVGGPIQDSSWLKPYLSDMSKSEVYKQLQNPDLALKSDSVVKAVPYAMETYGIIYNKAILSKYCEKSYAVVKSADEINSFEKLKAVADSIQEHKSDLGVDGAFTSAGFDSSSDWRFKTHLANMPLYFEMLADHITGQPKTLKGTYLNQYKNIFDLYLNDSTTPKTQLSSKTADDANSEFATGKAVFYQNGTWAWSDLQKSGFKADDLGMMPLYIGAGDEKNQGLTTGSENYWCINSKVSEADQKATEAFLKWMVTNKKGQDALAKDMGFVTPFKSMENIKSENPLTQIAQEDAKSGKKDVTWNFTIIPSTKWKDDLGSALLAYAQGTGTWDSVKKAFVDGWKTEYDATH